MSFKINEFTLLSEAQVTGSRKINVLEKMDNDSAATDFAILLGAHLFSNRHVASDSTLKGRTGFWHIKSSAGRKENWDVCVVSTIGIGLTEAGARNGCIRPVLICTDIPDILNNARRNNQGVLEVECGEYPQYVVGGSLRKELEVNFSFNVLPTTGKTYTTDSRLIQANSEKFRAREHVEYVYGGKKYIRFVGDSNSVAKTLSDGSKVDIGVPYWLEVSPITWYVDEKEGLLVSKSLLASGVRFCNNRRYKGNFKETEMYMFLNDYFAKDIIPSDDYEVEEGLEASEKVSLESLTISTIIRGKYVESNGEATQKRLDFREVSEEDIIRGMVEADIPVFLHGLSGDGKSSRVKQIDSESEEVHLGSITMDMLIGKSYVDTDGETKQAMPDWLRSLLRKCEEEPDRIHILFLDELTNALPSIQARVFNLVLEKKLEYFGKLPDNVRIVAAGNEMQDSLAANPLAEPLFGRFAHVYIKTTAETWLKWARENNIHPSIYAFISYKGDVALRSEYNGEKPNADPRSWEMASKMLYATGRPEMLRALIGEDLTREFVAFCRQRVITVEDVINGDYREEEIQGLNTAQRYATVVEISKVDEENIEVVREFAKSLGGEYRALFDSIWTKDSEERLEIIAELKMKEREVRK